MMFQRSFLAFFLLVFLIKSASLQAQFTKQINQQSTGNYAIDFSEKIRFKHYSHKDGYAEQSDFDIQMIQDRSGFLWIPTIDGVHCFDGREFKAYRHDRNNPGSLAEDRTTSIIEDKYGKIWIGTKRSGISILDPATGEYEHLRNDPADPKSLCSDEIFTLFVDQDSNVWVGGLGDDLCFCDPEQRAFKQFPITGVAGFLQQENGDLWVGSHKGLFQYLPESDTFQHYKPYPEYNSGNYNGANSMIESAEGEIWLTSKRNGQQIFNPKTKSFRDFPSVIKYPLGEAAHYLFKDNKGHFWMGESSAVSRYDPVLHKFKRYQFDPQDRTSCQDAPIINIFQDRAGSMWFNSYLKGKGLSVVHTTNNPFEILDLPKVYNISRLNAQQLLLGTETNGVQVFDTKNNGIVFTPLPLELKNGILLQAKLSNDHNLWWWDDNQKEVLRTNLKAQETKKTGITDFNFDLDSKGNAWLLSSNYYDIEKGEIVKYNRKELLEADSNWIKTDLPFYCMLVDKEDNVWLGSGAEGLVKYNTSEKSIRTFQPSATNPNALVPGDFTMILEGANGWIHCMTTEGYCIYQPEKDHFIQIEISIDGPKNQPIPAFMIEDDSGKIWMGSSDGLFKIDIQSEQVLKFDENDGLPTGTFNQLAAKDEFGRIYLAKDGNIFRFHPDYLKPDTLIAPIVITDFFLNRKKIKANEASEDFLEKNIHYQKNITLDHRQVNFGFRFVSPTFKNADLIQYYYMLENYDEDWVAIGNQLETHFRNVPAGDYTFKVKAKNASGFWTEFKSGIGITVLPPWWKTSWAYVLYFLTGIGLLYLLYRFLLNRQMAQQENQQLRELDLVKSRLYTNITHEFRTPLTVISGIADQLKEDTESKSIIKRNSDQLLNLVNQMLDLRKIESGSIRMQNKQGDIVKFIRYLTESLKSYAEMKSLKVHFLSNEKSLMMDFDREKIIRIHSNLLSNAIKFTQEGGNIYVQLRIENNPGVDQFVMIIRDTGVGIPKEKIPHIFDRFYQVDDSSTRIGEGTGIGLTLVAELVKAMQGKIMVKSIEGEGSSFEIHLPISNLAEIEDDMSLQQISNTAMISMATAGMDKEEFLLTEGGEDTRQTILIVEDNADVIHYLIQCLKSEYSIEIAMNGEEGIEKAFAYIPDIIVSDVMMPIKDGLELCQTLKLDERTSHIPITLLTAKADIEAKLEGLGHGADAYLSKPFHKDELLITLQKQLELRKRLHARFSQFSDPILTTNQTSSQHPLTAEINLEQEDAFLKKIRDLVEKDISNAEINTVVLVRSLGMSRSQIFKKVKALTGKSPSIYIRSIRLHHAHEMLKSSDLNVSEVAYAVGFKSPVYFSNMYLEEFGNRPNETRK